MNIKKFIYRKSKIFNLGQIFGGYAWQPFFILIHLTLNCNCRCQYCYQRDEPFYNKRNDFIKPTDFEDILADIKKSFLIKPKLHFFGGEPLLNPYFSQILDLADDYGMETSITTNGILLEQHLDQILKSNLKQINISIDDIGQKSDQIKQFKGCFQKVIDNIKKLRNKQGKKKKIININCVIIPDNYDHLIDLALYLRDNMMDIDVLAFQHMYFSPTGDKLKIDLAVLKSQIEKLKNLKTKFDILLIPNIKSKDLSAYYLIDDKVLYLRPRRMKQDRAIFKNNCNIPWFGLNILPNLEVTPGGAALGCNRVVGYLKKQTLKEIWNNSLMKQFRKNIIKYGLPKICFRCCYRQYY